VLQGSPLHFSFLLPTSISSSTGFPRTEIALSPSLPVLAPLPTLTHPRNNIAVDPTRPTPSLGVRLAARDRSWLADKPLTGPLKSPWKEFASISSHTPNPHLVAGPCPPLPLPARKSLPGPAAGNPGADRGRRSGAMPVERRGGPSERSGAIDGIRHRNHLPPHPLPPRPAPSLARSGFQTTRHSPPLGSQPQKLDILTDFRITRIQIFAWGSMEPVPG